MKKIPIKELLPGDIVNVFDGASFTRIKEEEDKDPKVI